MLSDGRRIETATVVWTAGVAANPLAARLGLPVDERGRLRVDETLRVVDVPGAWALGDCAAVPNAATPGALDPATCQHALRQARRLARNLRGAPRPYRYRTRGQMATLGRRHGIAVVAGLPVRGLPGWLVARGYHLLALPFISRRAPRDGGLDRRRPLPPRRRRRGASPPPPLIPKEPRCSLSTYPSLEAFYAADFRRRHSSERDLGLLWRDRGRRIVPRRLGAGNRRGLPVHV